MSIRDRVETELRQALKAQDARRLSCLRMLKSRLVEREVELRGERGPDCRLTDDEAQAVIASYAKQRRESIESYRRGGREDLAREEEAELELVARPSSSRSSRPRSRKPARAGPRTSGG
jgi:uncharacterized protein YqeY